MQHKKNTKAIAGNAGPGVRSDCQIHLELTNEGGLKIKVVSKVGTLYGTSIKEQLVKGLSVFGIKNARVTIEDKGALPFVIDARLEAAIKEVVKSNTSLLPEIMQNTQYPTTRDRIRYTRLYLPGNSPAYFLNAGIHKPDGVILDLEDSVAPGKKKEASYLVRNALRSIDFMGAERMVRINQLPGGLEDLPFIVPNNTHVILIPKCESARQVTEIEQACKDLLKASNHKKLPYFMPIIESALGVENAFDIAMASQNVVAMAIGLEDYTADLGVQRTKSGKESLYARMRLVNACKAAGIQPIDSVFSDVSDETGLLKSIKKSKALGFEGMGCVHPRQIKTIREGFLPGKEEITKASKIVLAFDEAKSKGLGVISFGTKMIDLPVVKRAQKTIDLAVEAGLLERDWKNK